MLGVSNTVQLNARIRNRAGTELSGKTIAWQSTASGIATVSPSGVVTAVAIGATQVSATVEGVSGSSTITVQPAPVATVTASLGAPVLLAGGATTAVAVARDAAGTELTGRSIAWASSNQSVATVTPQGVVNALAAGVSTITASTDGRTGAATVCVVTGAPNFRIDRVLVAQVTQKPLGEIPLVGGGLPAEARVYATSDPGAPSPPGGCVPLRIRLIGYRGQVEAFREEQEAASLPASMDIQVPAARFLIPADLVAPGLGLVAEVDPRDVYPETVAADNRWPSSGIAAQATVDVPPLELRFVPIFLSSGGSIGQVSESSMSEYLFATRQVYPVSRIDTEIGDTFSANVAFGGGEQGPWVSILQLLDIKRVSEGSRRYYVGALRPPPGVTSTQFGGFGYIPGDLSSIGPATRTNVLVGVGWFNRQRQTTELVAHELGHNHGRRHAPCGGAAGPDPLYPYPGAPIGVPGTDMYTWTLNGGSPPQLLPFSSFDIMSYCTPAWISDYNYQALMAARIAAGPTAATRSGASPGGECTCLIAWGSISGDEVTVNPAFVTRTRVQRPSKPGSWAVEGIRADGSRAFTWSFEPSEIDHAPDVRHFAMALPVTAAEMSVLASIRVTGPRGTGAITRLAGPGRESVAGPAARQASYRLAPDGTPEISWPGNSFRAAMVRNAATGEVLAIGFGDGIRLASGAREVDVILSDGVRSETVRMTRR